MSYIAFFKRCGISDLEKIEGLIKSARSLGWWWAFEGLAVLTPFPTKLNRDDRGRLHCADGAALLYPDGWAIHAVHGVGVPDWIIKEPSRLSVATIDAERNAEIRRVMMELFGQARYMIESKSERIHEDDYGTLYRKPITGDEPLVMVKVVNSTPEPDGSFKDYFLRVHPELRPMLSDGTLGDPQQLTARNAVASTFGKRGDDYAPVLQS